MATRNIVPRATGEGSIGTTVKRWFNGFFDKIKVDQVSIENNEVTPEVNNTVNLGADLKRWANGFFTSITTGVLKLSDVTLSQGSTPQVLNITATDGVGELQVEGNIVYHAGNLADPPPEIPAGSKMWFYQDSAPLGWTLDSTPSDSILAVKGGSTYNTGGASAGSWIVSGIVTDSESSHRHTGPSHKHTTAAVSLTIAQMPAHTHKLNSSNWQNGNGESGDQVRTNGTVNGITTTSVGSGSAHTHGDTGYQGTGNTGAGSAHSHTTSHVGGWRPKANVGIICRKS